MSLHAGIVAVLGLSSFVFAAAPATFDVQFKGGTLSEWVDTIRGSSPQSNIMLQPADSHVVVPALSLHGVTSRTCVELVGEIPDVSVMEIGQGGGRSVWVIDAHQYVRVATARGRATRHPIADETHVFELPMGYREVKTATQLQSVMERICRMGCGSEPAIAVFPQWGLIAVNGNQVQLRTCESVIRSTPPRRSGASREQDGDESSACSAMQLLRDTRKSRAFHVLSKETNSDAHARPTKSFPHRTGACLNTLQDQSL